MVFTHGYAGILSLLLLGACATDPTNDPRGGGFFGGTFGGIGGGGYQNTEIGQVIVLAYLDAYKQMVTQLGGLPEDASLDAPPAE